MPDRFFYVGHAFRVATYLLFQAAQGGEGALAKREAAHDVRRPLCEGD